MSSIGWVTSFNAHSWLVLKNMVGFKEPIRFKKEEQTELWVLSMENVNKLAILSLKKIAQVSDLKIGSGKMWATKCSNKFSKNFFSLVSRWIQVDVEIQRVIKGISIGRRKVILFSWQFYLSVYWKLASNPFAWEIEKLLNLRRFSPTEKSATNFQTTKMIALKFFQCR